jgi:hypothetical protein
VSRSYYFFFPPKTSPVAPRVGQRVRIEGQPGTYIVLHLHPKRFSADLMSTTGRHEIEEKVPYFAIEPFNEKQSDEKRSDEKRATEKYVPEESKNPSPAGIR